MDSGKEEPPTKRLKEQSQRKSLEWRLYNPSIGRSLLKEGGNAFFRPKSSTRPCRRGRLESFDSISQRWEIQWSDDETTGNVSVKRLLPIFHTPSTKLLILVTADTTNFRNLATSQLQSTDSVLELGCSTGGTSKIIWKVAKSWVGLDTGKDMVAATRALADSLFETSNDPSNMNPQGTQNACQLTCQVLDAIMDRQAALDVVTSHQATTDVVFLDIGGNRAQNGVLQMLEWVLDSFQTSLRLVVIKSEDVYQSLQSIVDQETGEIPTGKAWFEEHLKSVRAIPKHPLQAGKRFSPVNANQMICRYHNYHIDGCKKGDECEFDHVHCHMCRQAGHRAVDCPGGARKD